MPHAPNTTVRVKCAVTMNVDLGNGDNPITMAEAGEYILLHSYNNGVYTASGQTSGGEMFYVTEAQITDLLAS